MDNQELSALFDDWEAFQRLGHRIVDDLASFLSTLRERPVFEPLSTRELALFDEPLPLRGMSADIVYERLRERVMPTLLGNIHPRYWGWADGSGLPLAALADLVASACNPNVEGIDHGACHLERQVIRWWAEIFGLPADASGLLVSGTSTANLLALSVARNVAGGESVRSHGVAHVAPMTFYASREVHSSIIRAVEILGIGRLGLRLVAAHSDGTMNVAELVHAIDADLQTGLQPACIVATVGTTTTGAIDDLVRIANVADEYGLWLHVDGAFGALARLAPSCAPLLKGIDRASSIAFDLHKWFYLPFGVGCLLVRSPADHLRTFSMHPDYLEGLPAPAASFAPFSSLGIETSREFRALRVWLCMRVYGLQTFAQAIEANLDQASHLRRRIERERDIELIAPAPLNIVCFRWRPFGGASDAQLDEVNREILRRMHTDGFFIVSGASVGGAYVLRAAIMNHRTTLADLDSLIDEVVTVASGVTGSAGAD